jgi:hypothetical protein
VHSKLRWARCYDCMYVCMYAMDGRRHVQSVGRCQGDGFIVCSSSLAANMQQAELAARGVSEGPGQAERGACAWRSRRPLESGGERVHETRAADDAEWAQHRDATWAGCRRSR